MAKIDNVKGINEKNTERVCAIDNSIKQVIKNDDVNTLKAMINNGFDINSFRYKGQKGIDAFVLYKYEVSKESMGDVMKLLLIEMDKVREASEKTIELLDEIAFNTFKEKFSIEGLVEFIGEGLAEAFGEFMESLNDEECDEEELRFRTLMLTKKLPREKTSKNKAVQKDVSEEIVDKEPSKEDIVTKEVVKEEIKNSDLVTTKETNKASKEFELLGDANYKVASISASIVLENEETCDRKQVCIHASNIEELTSIVNKEIELANNESNEKLANSVVEMMNSNSEFKKNLLALMREAQIK